MSVQRTSVVVVGGGLSGLTTALVLRHHGIDVTLLEKHTNTSPQPKARRFHVRTMEIFRDLGLATRVADAARELATGNYHMARGRTLAESVQVPMLGRSELFSEPSEVSPEEPVLIAQDMLEPLLREAAVAAGADVRFGVAAGPVEQDAAGVTVAVPDGLFRADYLVAADGARSPIRTAADIARVGRGAIGERLTNVYFRADLADVVRGREFNLCSIEHPDAGGTLASIGAGRWLLMTSARDRDWPSYLRTGLGVPVPELEILSVMEWQPECLVAERFVDGRVLLAGDAAHVMPPWAAKGANTGIADAYDLGWMLAAVVRGEAGPQLLACYDAERRPAATFYAEESVRRMGEMRSAFVRTAAGGSKPVHELVLAVEGFQYPSGALCEVTDPEPVARFAPAGRVGTRVPHLWVAPGVSTIDLAGPGWALLVADDPAGWSADCPVHRIAADWLPSDTAVLLRPDQVVAWRGTDHAAPARIRQQLLAGAPQPARS